MFLTHMYSLSCHFNSFYSVSYDSQNYFSCILCGSSHFVWHILLIADLFQQ